MEGFLAALASPVTIGIVVALVVGKPIGIAGSTWILTKITRAELDPAVRWIDFIGVAVLAGIGFTVSLLLAELSFGFGSDHGDQAKVAILVASVVAALLAMAVLVARDRRYAQVAREEAMD